MSRIIILTATYSIVVMIAMVFGNRNIFHSFSRRWSSKILKLCKVDVQIICDHDFDFGGTNIYVSNHSSLFDIPILLSTIASDVRIMYKRELERIPVFGWGLKLSPFIPVTRTDPRNAMAAIEDALNSIKGKFSVIIFPEGTRSKDGTLGAFKRGAFFLASRAGKPIVPITIVGSSKILPAGTMKINPGTVQFIIHPTIEPVADQSSQDEKNLMKQVRDTINTPLQTVPTTK